MIPQDQDHNQPFHGGSGCFPPKTADTTDVVFRPLNEVTSHQKELEDLSIRPGDILLDTGTGEKVTLVWVEAIRSIWWNPTQEKYILWPRTSIAQVGPWQRVGRDEKARL